MGDHPPCPPLGPSDLTHRHWGQSPLHLLVPCPHGRGTPASLLLEHHSRLPEGPAPLTRCSSTRRASRARSGCWRISVRACPMSEEGLLSFTSLPISMNPVRTWKHLRAVPPHPSSYTESEQGPTRAAAPGAGPGQLRTGSLTHPHPHFKKQRCLLGKLLRKVPLCSCCAEQARRRPSAGSAPIPRNSLPFFPEIHWCLLGWRSGVLDSSSHQRRGQEAVLPQTSKRSLAWGSRMSALLLPHGCFPSTHFRAWGLGLGEAPQSSSGSSSSCPESRGEGLLRRNAPRLLSRLTGQHR